MTLYPLKAMISHSRPRRAVVAPVAVVAALVLIAACSSSAKSKGPVSTASAAASASTASASTASASTASAAPAASSVLAASSSPAASSAPAGSDSQLQGIINRAMLVSSVTPSQLDPLILETFQKAAAPLDSTQTALFEKCLQSDSCETGHGNITIAFADSNGQNPWRQAFRAEGTAQAILYPQVSKIIYTNAHGDLNTFLSQFRSLIAQKVNVIAGAFDFGSSMLPLLAQAKAAHILVVPTTEPIPNAPADQIAFSIVPSICDNWTGLGKALISQYGQGKSVALYTGPAGNPYAGVWLPCFKSAVQAAGWTIATTGYTGWTPQGAQQQASALISSGKKVDVIVYDYTPEAFAEAYLSAGKQPPAMVSGSTSDAGFITAYRQAQAKNLPFTGAVSQGASWELRVAVTGAMDILAGKSVPALITPPQPIATLVEAAAVTPATVPADIPLGNLIPPGTESVVMSAS